MKKAYFNPQMVVVNIEAPQLLAGSTLGIGNPVENAFDACAPMSDYDLIASDELL